MRLHSNFDDGTLSVALPASGTGSTTMSSLQLAGVPAVVAPDVYPVVLDPAGVGGTPEVAWITAHTANATTATLLRGQETADGGSSARAHAAGTKWAHAPLASDLRFQTAEIGYAQSTAAFSTASATAVDITGLSTTVACDGSPLRIEVNLPQVSNSVAGQAFAVYLVEDGATIATQVGEKSTAANDANPFSMPFRHVPTPGTHTYKVQISRTFGGSGTIDSVHSLKPGFIWVLRA